MSYNQLPTELKRLIVAHVHQADASYRRRRETEGRRVLRARSLASFSRVNKECRQLALPYIMTVRILHSRSLLQNPADVRFLLHALLLTSDFTGVESQG